MHSLTVWRLGVWVKVSAVHALSGREKKVFCVFLSASGVAGNPECTLPCRHMTPHSASVISWCSLWLCLSSPHLNKNTSHVELSVHPSPVWHHPNYYVFSDFIFEIRSWPEILGRAWIEGRLSDSVQYLRGYYSSPLKCSLMQQVNVRTCCYLEENKMGKYGEGG